MYVNVSMDSQAHNVKHQYRPRTVLMVTLSLVRICVYVILDGEVEYVTTHFARDTLLPPHLHRLIVVMEHVLNLGNVNVSRDGPSQFQWEQMV